MKYQDKASFKKANYFGTGIPNFMLKGNMTGTSYIKPLKMAGHAMIASACWHKATYS